MISWCSDLDGYVPGTKLAVRLGINPRRLRRQIRCRGLERVVIGRLSPSGRHGYLLSPSRVLAFVRLDWGTPRSRWVRDHVTGVALFGRQLGWVLAPSRVA
jgi:hypothetical protein